MSRARYPRKYAVLAALFVLGTGLGLLAWKFIRLPFRNPWNVTGPLTLVRLNPANNIARFGLVVLLPTALLFLLVLAWRERSVGMLFFEPGAPVCRPGPRPSRGVTVLLAFLLIVLAIVAALNFPTFPSDAPVMDTFHEGESLGPGECLAQGQAPYRDFVFVHGPYEDPIRCVLAWKLFGRSIASVRTLQSLNKIIGFLLLAFMLFRLFQGDWLFTFLTFVLIVFFSGPLAGPFYRNPIVMYFPERDMTAFAFIITVTYMWEALKADTARGRRLFVISAFMGFFALVPFAYSIDRGFYNAGTYAVLVLLLFIAFFYRKGLRLTFISSTLLGVAAGLLVLGFAIRWEYGAFFRFAFLDMPRYKELMDGFVYPIRSAFGVRMVLLIALVIFWTGYQFLRVYEKAARRFMVAVRSFLREYLVELALLMLAVFSFRSALGRADMGHIQYSSAFTYLLLVFIFIKHYLARWLTGLGGRKVFAAGLAIVLAVLIGVDAYRIVDRDRFDSNFPVVKGYEDSYFIPDEYQNASTFLSGILKPGENFVTMTNEASYYYFVGRPSPVRFPVVWFAMPEQFQREMVVDMEKNNVRYVIYRNRNPVNNIDNIKNVKRLPIVFDYIDRNYEPYRTIDGTEIWIRKEPPRD
ncbi:MAG: hypothetical protein V1748_02335 [Actinomycetota bacterium]